MKNDAPNAIFEMLKTLDAQTASLWMIVAVMLQHLDPAMKAKVMAGIATFLERGSEITTSEKAEAMKVIVRRVLDANEFPAKP